MIIEAQGILSLILLSIIQLIGNASLIALLEKFEQHFKPFGFFGEILLYSFFIIVSFGGMFWYYFKLRRAQHEAKQAKAEAEQVRLENIQLQKQIESEL